MDGEKTSVANKDTTSGDDEDDNRSMLCGWNSKSKIEKRIFLSRTLVFFSFALTGALLASFAYFFLSREEENSYETQYQALADDFTLKVQYGLHLAHFSSASAAGMISFLHEGQWPFVWVHGFDELYLQTSSTSYVIFSGLAPLLRKDQVDEFNVFTGNYTDALIRDYFTAKPYNESTGYFGEFTSLHNESLILPVSNIAPTFFAPLTNVDAFAIGGYFFEDIETCVLQHNGTFLERMHECSVLTSIVDSSTDAHLEEPSFFLLVPVVDVNQVAAFMITAITLNNMLQDLAPPNMSPVTCVVERAYSTIFINEEDTFTYKISGEGIELLGKGDLHDSSFNDMKRTASISIESAKSVNSSQYVMTFYPTEEFRNSYNSRTPLVTCLLFGVVSALLMVIFISYDKAVHADSLAREVILETKKNFVRYISHEIRTPLNTVLLGLKVLHVVRSLEDHHTNEKDESPQSESTMKVIADIATEVKTGATVAVNVLNDLLDYDRLDMSRMNIIAKPIPAVRFLRSTISTLRRQLIDNANLTNISFTSNLFASQDSMEEGGIVENIEFGVNNVVPSSDVYIMGDIYRLAQVMRHMISNSLKYAPYDGEVSVIVNWREVGVSGKLLKGTLNKQQSRQYSQQYSKQYSRQISRQYTRQRSIQSEKGRIDDEVYEKYASLRCGVMSFSVKDNGPGISKDFLSEVFTDQFDFDTRLGRSKGLGLCISKQIISLHRGHIWATGKSDDVSSDEEEEEKSPNEGTTFTIELPVYSLADERKASLSNRTAFFPDNSFRNGNSSLASVSNRHQSVSSTVSRHSADSSDPVITSPTSINPSVRSGSGKMNSPMNSPIRIKVKYNRILVVDDSGPSRKIVCKLLNRRGFVTDQAVDGVQCIQMMEDSALTPEENIDERAQIKSSLIEDDNDIELFNETVASEAPVKYDCVLLDSEMPKMNGPTAARRLRGMGYKLPIIGLTGNVLAEDVANFLQHGADHVMFKPFNYDSFNLMVEREDDKDADKDIENDEDGE
mmetsp:Transcript_17157/g.28687  ORF Transcript_17157/g.28687 Transcript_17157/m.28687 type:complete len:1014 (-) Transcript_17157:413-3454(-)